MGTARRFGMTGRLGRTRDGECASVIEVFGGSVEAPPRERAICAGH